MGGGLSRSCCRYCQCSPWRRGWPACWPPPRWALLTLARPPAASTYAPGARSRSASLGWERAFCWWIRAAVLGGLMGRRQRRLIFPLTDLAVTGGRWSLPSGCSGRSAGGHLFCGATPPGCCAAVPGTSFGNEESAWTLWIIGW